MIISVLDGFLNIQFCFVAGNLCRPSAQIHKKKRYRSCKRYRFPAIFYSVFLLRLALPAI